MKKIIVFLLSFVIALSFVGCSSNTNSDATADGFYSQLEKHRQLKNYELTLSYDEMQNIAEEIYVNPKTYLKDSELIFQNGDAKVTVGDLKTISEEKLKEYKQMIETLKNEKGEEFFNPKQTIKLSDIYEDKQSGRKYIFEQHVCQFKDPVGDEVHQYTNTRYQFKQEDGKWKIFAIDFAMENYVEARDKDKNEEEVAKKIGYNTFNNEPVKYVKTIELNK